MVRLPKRKVSAETYTVSTRVTKTILEEIEKIIKDGHYMDVGDYIRDIIRRDLEARKTEKNRDKLA